MTLLTLPLADLQQKEDSKIVEKTLQLYNKNYVGKNRPLSYYI